MGSGVSRSALLTAFVARDGARRVAAPVLALPAGVGPEALSAAIAWLCASHDVTGRHGSSKGYSLLHGWQPAYPETTGYVLGTLLEQARRTGHDPDLVLRALEMGRWEASVREDDGGIMEGHVETRPRRSVVFNTGMVLHGWEDLIDAGHDEFAAPAAAAAAFLIDHMREDGTWDPIYEYGAMAHTYNTRVAWALLRWARRTGSERGLAAGRRPLDWACERQQASGWFDDCVFRPGTTPSTHALAYTMRGLLESFCLLGEERWLGAVRRAAEPLAAALDAHPMLPANYHPDWRPAAAHACLTGTVQLGGVWLRLYQETGEERWLHPGLKAVEQAAGRQERSPAVVRGALAGSFPLWGRYAPLQYPNWATKFLADGLMLYEDCLDGAAAPGVGSVTPRGAP